MCPRAHSEAYKNIKKDSQADPPLSLPGKDFPDVIEHKFDLTSSGACIIPPELFVSTHRLSAAELKLVLATLGGSLSELQLANGTLESNLASPGWIKNNPAKVLQILSDPTQLMTKRK